MNRAALRLLAAGVSLFALSATTSSIIAAPLDLEPTNGINLFPPQQPVSQYPGQYPEPRRPGSQRMPPQAAAPEPVRVQQVSAPQGNMGGGFIEFLFSGGGNQQPQPQAQPEPAPQFESSPVPMQQSPRYQQEPEDSAYAPMPATPRPEIARPAINPRFLPQVVNYQGPEKPGTIIIDTRIKHLFLVQENGKALRYGVGVGKPGFEWAGTKLVTRKREWPDWTPPPEMIQRRPDLPRHMEGGPENPLGARALYLGSTLYRIHGSNEPWTIGTNVSSGCIRMRNEDVVDLYGRVKVGTKVVVL